MALSSFGLFDLLVLALRLFHKIYERTDGEYPQVGFLTASDRDTWAKVCWSPFFKVSCAEMMPGLRASDLKPHEREYHA